jgi:hypothetical protein
LDEDVVWDKARGELRILGQRHTAVDMQGFCEHLDLIVGPKIAEVVMNQHGLRQGKEDAANARQKNLNATLPELVDAFVNAVALSGVGVMRIVVRDGSSSPIDLEISNPCVKQMTGSARSFLFSYWCGVFSTILGKEFKIDDVSYDEKANLMKCRILPR